MVLEGRLTRGGGGPVAARAGSLRGRGRRQRAFILPMPSTPEQLVQQANIETVVSRFSPNTLYSETVHILLNPVARTFGPVLQEQLSGILPTPLALSQSLLLIFPHIATLLALVAVCFAISYIKFMRTEIRT